MSKQPRHRQLSEAEMEANRRANRAVLVSAEYDWEEMVAAECDLLLRNTGIYAAWLAKAGR